MTQSEILALPPGKNLDALVAEKVLKWQKRFYTDRLWWWHSGDEKMICLSMDEPHFSTDVYVAWERIVEGEWGNRPDRAGKRFYFKLDSVISAGWFVEVWDEYAAVNSVPHGSGGTGIRVYADTAPHAICLAALLASNI